MKTATIFFFLCCTILVHTLSYCQKFWDHTFLIGGFAFSNQDRRLFEFPNQEEVLEMEDTKLDYEYNIYLQKRFLKFGKFQSDVGIGYAAFINTFSRPYNHTALNGGMDRLLRFNKIYITNKVIFPISNKLFLNEKQLVFLNFSIIPSVSFRKSVKRPPETHTKWEFEFNALELYPGLGVNLSPRIWVTANYRLFYFYKIDEVIFNSTLFNERDPEFLQKDYDTYNPFKLWFTLSYALGE